MWRRVGWAGREGRGMPSSPRNAQPPPPPRLAPNPFYMISIKHSLTHTVCSSSPPTLPALYIKEKKFFLTTVTATLEPLD